MVLRWLRGIFGREETSPADSSASLFGLDEAERAEQSGDPEKAIRLYETSVAEGFVGSHPYERLASLYERRHDHEAALRVSEAFLQLAASGKMPKGAQRSADRKLPQFEVRAQRYRRLLDDE